MYDEEYRALEKNVIADNLRVVREIEKRGKQGKLMFLVGQMMRRGPEGRTEARKAEETLRRLIRMPV